AVSRSRAGSAATCFSPGRSSTSRTTASGRRGSGRSSQGRRRYERGRQRGSDLARIHFDDLSLQRRQQVQKLVLFGFPDLEVVQTRDDVFHEGLELAARHAHVEMRLRHVAPRVSARPAGRLTDQVDELFDHPVYVGPRELLVDAVVLHLAIYNGADDCRDGIDSAEALIQGTIHRSYLLCSRRPGSAASPHITHP